MIFNSKLHAAMAIRKAIKESVPVKFSNGELGIKHQDARSTMKLTEDIMAYGVECYLKEHEVRETLLVRDLLLDHDPIV